MSNTKHSHCEIIVKYCVYEVTQLRKILWPEMEHDDIYYAN